MHCTSTSRKRPAYTPQRMQYQDSSLLLGRKLRVPNKNYDGTLRGKQTMTLYTCSKEVLPQNQARYSEYIPEERV